ncbi:MoaD/ThiS family protein [Caldisericum exile]|uniref:MoaD/ThiS family protein n=1 Tax=Caldisericum exile (strain DSM 21853 / NBRC 104410 / AZM16c01) TaxID=511051 RepID=A0A7U6JEM6_CALEA|nr:MoaD/ThiS family protein [Caldisericum exile]BAL80886.1 hypothetical protein CSE_07600 [Caldisericum exile AZM16c01]
MARVTIFLHGDLREKLGIERLYLKADTVKDLIEQLKDKFPNLEDDVKFGRLIILINGRNIETLLKEATQLEDFDLVSLTLKDGGMIDFFPPDGGG